MYNEENLKHYWYYMLKNNYDTNELKLIANVVAELISKGE